MSSLDAHRLEDLPESVPGLVLWREDEGDGLPAAVTPADGGQELVEVGTPGCHLQSGGGRHQYGPPVDVDILESGHDTSNLRQGRVYFWPPELNF